MTSLPIIFYALFDFEYDKGTDQDEPSSSLAAKNKSVTVDAS